MEATVQDIKKRKKTEEFLENIENFRKKEICHRIMNYLQLISSLLDIQLKSSKTEKAYKL
jgi:two-component sensor histidine kinase